MSFKFFIRLIEGEPVPFALNYSFGNVLALASSWFLCGPKRQYRNMFDEKRKLTSLTYLSCLVGTLVVVFIPLPTGLRLGLLLLLLVTQCGASLWYSLSYIPYGRKTALNIIKRTFGLNEQPVEGL
jgi:ABC-type sugar transport system permease subunit